MTREAIKAIRRKPTYTLKESTHQYVRRGRVAGTPATHS
jgi:hypothetical protein